MPQSALFFPTTSFHKPYKFYSYFLFFLQLYINGMCSIHFLAYNFFQYNVERMLRLIYIFVGIKSLALVECWVAFLHGYIYHNYLFVLHLIDMAITKYWWLWMFIINMRALLLVLFYWHVYVLGRIVNMYKK